MYSYIVNLTKNTNFSINTNIVINDVNDFCKYVIRYNKWNSHDEIIFIINNNHIVLRFKDNVVEHIDMSFILHNNINLFDEYTAFLTNKRNILKNRPPTYNVSILGEISFNSEKEYYYYMFKHFSNDKDEFTYLNNDICYDRHDIHKIHKYDNRYEHYDKYDSYDIMYYDNMYYEQYGDYNSECWESIDL